ncbi:MAG: poly-gamma-glutamate system protein [Planctomycetales bacterium]|nr:poly-gamma-glutamate system protein [Planctomycetales bacterium]
MKKVYWRPRTVSRTALMLVAMLSLVSLVITEVTKTEQKRAYLPEKTEATQTAAKAFAAIKEARINEGPPIDSKTDPLGTGLVGLPTSVITSVRGVLPAKQVSINPNFAAVIVEQLMDAGVRPGDAVALGLSGSFPALNICSVAACETLGADPLVISSASASEWGANVPTLMWIDMERILNEQDILHTRSLAVSPGGMEDEGPITEEGMAAVREGVERNGLKLIEENTLEKHVERRLKIYRDALKGRPIKCYINVGGGATSVGTHIGKDLFNPGLNTTPPPRVGRLPGVMPKLIQEGIPCIHLVNIVDLATKYGLIEQLPEPDLEGREYEQITEVGEAGIFQGIDYQRPIVIACLATILMALWGFIRTDIGFRLLRGGARKSAGPPEPMV